MYPEVALCTYAIHAIQDQRRRTSATVEREIRQEFVAVCRGEGKTAAQVLREYTRDCIARNRAAAQQELFTGSVSNVHSR
ncbi:MAG: hypothetical protein ACYCV6_17255 [Steroidobacteraceae bacterium]